MLSIEIVLFYNQLVFFLDYKFTLQRHAILVVHILAVILTRHC